MLRLTALVCACLLPNWAATQARGATADPRRAARTRRQHDDGLVMLPERLIPARDRAALVERIEAAARRLGSPLRVVVVKRLRGGGGASALASRMFGEWTATSTAGGDRQNPILLLLSVGDDAAAIETGKGSAGIVPEIDARQIVARLTSPVPRQALFKRLSAALGELVDSAEATEARRRPLPRPPPSVLTEAAPPEPPQPATVEPGPSAAPTTAASHRRSKLPLAIASSILVVLGFALRRRRQLARDRKAIGTSPAPRPTSGRRS